MIQFQRDFSGSKMNLKRRENERHDDNTCRSIGICIVAMGSNVMWCVWRWNVQSRHFSAWNLLFYIRWIFGFVCWQSTLVSVSAVVVLVLHAQQIRSSNSRYKVWLHLDLKRERESIVLFGYAHHSSNSFCRLLSKRYFFFRYLL